MPHTEMLSVDSHPAQKAGAGFVAHDAPDARVGMRRAQHVRVQLPLQIEIITEFAATGEQPRVFPAQDRLADSE